MCAIILIDALLNRIHLHEKWNNDNTIELQIK